MLAGDTGLLAALLQKWCGVDEPEKYAAFFGAMFESTLNSKTWRSGGMHSLKLYSQRGMHVSIYIVDDGRTAAADNKFKCDMDKKQSASLLLIAYALNLPDILY